MRVGIIIEGAAARQIQRRAGGGTVGQAGAIALQLGQTGDLSLRLGVGAGGGDCRRQLPGNEAGNRPLAADGQFTDLHPSGPEVIPVRLPGGGSIQREAHIPSGGVHIDSQFLRRTVISVVEGGRPVVLGKQCVCTVTHINRATIDIVFLHIRQADNAGLVQPVGFAQIKVYPDIAGLMRMGIIIKGAAARQIQGGAGRGVVVGETGAIALQLGQAGDLSLCLGVGAGGGSQYRLFSGKQAGNRLLAVNAYLLQHHPTRPEVIPVGLIGGGAVQGEAHIAAGLIGRQGQGLFGVAVVAFMEARRRIGVGKQRLGTVCHIHGSLIYITMLGAGAGEVDLVHGIGGAHIEIKPHLPAFVGIRIIIERIAAGQIQTAGLSGAVGEVRSVFDLRQTGDLRLIGGVGLGGGNCHRLFAGNEAGTGVDARVIVDTQLAHRDTCLHIRPVHIPKIGLIEGEADIPALAVFQQIELHDGADFPAVRGYFHPCSGSSVIVAQHLGVIGKQGIHCVAHKHLAVIQLIGIGHDRADKQPVDRLHRAHIEPQVYGGRGFAVVKIIPLNTGLGGVRIQGGDTAVGHVLRPVAVHKLGAGL